MNLNFKYERSLFFTKEDNNKRELFMNKVMDRNDTGWKFEENFTSKSTSFSLN